MSRALAPLANRWNCRAAVTLALAMGLALMGCRREHAPTESWSGVVTDLLRINEGVAGTLATIEASGVGDVDTHALRLTSLAEQLDRLADRTKALADPSPKESKDVVGRFADPLRDVHRRVQQMAMAIDPALLATGAISTALFRVSEASARESKLLAARLGSSTDAIPWYAPLVFQDTLENLAADALRFKRNVATILVHVSDRFTAINAGRQLDNQVAVLKAYKARHKQLGRISDNAVISIRESPAQIKAAAVLGAEFQRIAKTPERWDVIRKPLVQLSKVGAPRFFGNYEGWVARIGPGTSRQPSVPGLFGATWRPGIGWGRTFWGSGLEAFEPIVESACVEFGQYQVLVMRISHVRGTSARVMAHKFADYLERAGASADAHPLSHVSVWGRADYVVLAPVNDFQALLAEFDFGTVSNLDRESLTLELALDPARRDEFRATKKSASD